MAKQKAGSVLTLGKDSDASAKLQRILNVWADLAYDTYLRSI